jgi:hypothetical protein
LLYAQPFLFKYRAGDRVHGSKPRAQAFGKTQKGRLLMTGHIRGAQTHDPGGHRAKAPKAKKI